ncbi:hypothetical protein NDU88_005943 [Pleurodeles waltl]|uniref:Uncharacterized protein n=1 Tax=Pleurodeles waltl TaxID=8319 RepID=A0AAV7UK53_PLEWA|nr:hypothetical protein NDU88_005943 [Pleurodeles waltl]
MEASSTQSHNGIAEDSSKRLAWNWHFSIKERKHAPCKGLRRSLELTMDALEESTARHQAVYCYWRNLRAAWGGQPWPR